jgi:dolichol-phosphate mannosyltransferase
VRTLLIVPTYEEADNIDEVLRRARKALPAADVLVVDDNSADGTADLAEALGTDLGSISVLRRPSRDGLGVAYLAGFTRALEDGYDIVVEIDADLSHDPGELPALVSIIEHGADLAIGSRYVPGGSTPGWPWRRRFLSRWGNRYIAGMLGLAVNDATSGYRAYRADRLRALDLGHVRADGYAFQIEMAYRLVRRGAKVVELPIAFVDRERGESKMSARIVLEAFAWVTLWGTRDILTLRRRSS